MPKALIIGAGKQGRGILAYICYINGLTPVFVDQDEALIHDMKQQQTYAIHLMQDEKSIQLPCEMSIHSSDIENMKRYMKEASLIFTSVPSKYIQAAGRMVGQVLLELLQEQQISEKNIILCENSSDKVARFQNGLRSVVCAEDLKILLEDIGICEALSMSLATQPTSKESYLAVRVQQKMRLYVNKNRMKGDLPKYKAIHYVDNYESLRQQALYTNNTSSAFVSYLGHLMGYQTLAEAMQDSYIKEQLDLCYNEINLTLTKELGVSPTDQKEFADFARKKYEHSDDQIERHAKEVLRKLGREERLTGICEMALKHGIVPQTISLGLAAALFYEHPQDKESIVLASMRKQMDIEALLQQVCGIDKEDMLVDLIYQNITWLLEHHYLCHDRMVTKLSDS